MTTRVEKPVRSLSSSRPTVPAAPDSRLLGSCRETLQGVPSPISDAPASKIIYLPHTPRALIVVITLMALLQVATLTMLLLRR